MATPSKIISHTLITGPNNSLEKLNLTVLGQSVKIDDGHKSFILRNRTIVVSGNGYDKYRIEAKSGKQPIVLYNCAKPQNP